MLRKSLITIALLVSGAVAQTTTPAASGANPAKKTSSTATKPASQTVSKATAAPKARATKPAGPAKMAAKKPMMKTRVMSQSAASKPFPARPAPVAKYAGRRDPFISPLRLQEDRMKATSICTTGARCLIIDQVVLKGIVKTPGGMIAMVENASNKQYNLREKDPVFNGQVLKITGDSLIFRETVTDTSGKQTTREVVKRVTAPVI